MTDLAEQLAILRKKVAGIDLKYASAAPRLREFTPAAEVMDIDTVLPGTVTETEHGKHFETEKVYEQYRRHGSVDLSDLIELPEDFLEALSDGAIVKSHPERWAFLDTETTGLAGGSGTYAFLIGVGSIEPDGFRVRQFFMRDYGEEKSQLAALTAHLARFDVLITYNGKTFDQPLLETRYTMARTRHPFGRMEHLDLLCGARRLWKLRLENCRLSFLEQEILGVERSGDVAGAMIPALYFDYVRTRCAAGLVPIFYHNAMDIVTLACLTALVPQAFRDPHRVEVRHGADLLGLSRWLVRQERESEALGLMRRAVEIGLPDALLFRTIFEIGLLEKKRGELTAAVTAFGELVEGRNPYRVKAYEELAKYYEHRERNYGMALEMVQAALECEKSDALRMRRVRLEGKVRRKQYVL